MRQSPSGPCAAWWSQRQTPGLVRRPSGTARLDPCPGAGTPVSTTHAAPNPLELRLDAPHCRSVSWDYKFRAMTNAPVSAELLSQQVQAGRLWLIIQGQVYDATAWSAVHPGGSLLLQHSAGLDVSEAFAGRPQVWPRTGLNHPYVAGSACWQGYAQISGQHGGLLLQAEGCCMGTVQAA